MQELAEKIKKKITLLKEKNLKKHNLYSCNKKKVTIIGENWEEIYLAYHNLLSNLSNDFFEKIHEIKFKFKHYDRKY